MISKALIIPAAGSGSRMGKEIPKPYLKLSGRTLLEHTIRCFLPLQGLDKIVVATSRDYLATAKGLLDNIVPAGISFKCLVGGAQRQQSVYYALTEISRLDLVIVHDAVRPFVKLEHIERCCSTARKVGAAVLGIPANDTIKQVDDKQFVQQTPSREFLWKTQTPQVFQSQVLVNAYEKANQDNFLGTDDSSLVERLGQKVKMVKGDQSNIKITYPVDLRLAQLLMGKDQI